MKQIFEETKLGKLTIKNRLVRSATFENGCGDYGHIKSELEKVYHQLAEGGVGLIITGMMSAAHNAGVSDNMIKIYEDSFVNDFAPIVDAIHNCDGKIVVQLGHCGAKASVIDKGEYAFAPSDIELGGKTAKEMTKKQINDLVKEYGISARKCKEAGADGVQIHGGHGYLVSEFLSPYFNHRTDEYGGNIENRARLLFEIYDEIRSQVGTEYPILIKINYSDLVEGGNTGVETSYVCKELEKREIDAIELTSGISVNPESAPTQPGRKEEGFFTEGALDIAGQITTAVISVGGYRSLDKIKETLNAGNIEAISICRPLICEPDLPRKWQNGDTDKAICVSCSQCFGMPVHGCKVFGA
ncbi:MAG: NADH:flavin oxidoreductase [Eubacteriales bacterium]|nr:NADH:flavin oxidoreductase [Eubacteriales bacterium]